MTGAAPHREILVHRVIARLNVGGPAMHVVHLTHRMNDGRPFRTRLVAGSVMETEGDMQYFADERGVGVTRIPTLSRAIAPLRDLRSLIALWRLFRRERPDVVHTHTAKAGALGRLAATLAGVPVLIHTFHGHVLGGDYFSSWKTRFFRWLERTLGRRTNRLVVLSEVQKREMSEELRIAEPERFEVVPLGLDLQPFARSEPEAVRADVRDELGLAPDDHVVGVVGRLVPIKNHELLLDAMVRLAGREAPVRLLVVGSGERESELKRYARSAGLELRDVRWLGWRRDLPRLHAAMDVLALPSHDEGTPVAVIEALAGGVPVVARGVGGVAAVLEDGRWGRIVAAAEDAEGFARALAEVLERPPTPERREAARDSVLARFGVERLVGDLERLYVDELTGPSVREPAGTPPAAASLESSN